MRQRIVIEVDGYATRRTATALTSGNERQNRIVQLGWTILRFTWWQVVKRPDEVARTILVTLAAQEGLSA